MIDFKRQRDDLIEYIENNYLDYLIEYNIEKPFITDEFIDFDKFKKKFVCYIEFDSSSFPTVNQFNDDCSNIENLITNIYLVFREDTANNLNDKMLNATTAFIKMIKKEQMNKIINSNVNRVDFFKYIEGNNNIVSSKLILEINKEI